MEFTADRRKYTDRNGNVIETGASKSDYEWKWRNEILFDDPEANATGDKKPTDPVGDTYSLGDKVWLDEDKDGLQTEGEQGVEGVTVKLTGGDLTEEKTTKTDANGNYKFEGLKNGDYKVTFEVPEGYEITKTNVGTDDEKDSDGKEVSVTIKDADNMSIDLGLVKKETPTTPSKPEEPTVPSTPEEPTLPSTPDEPEETTPLIPLTPADPVEEVKNNDDKEVEKPEENSEETKKLK